MDAKLLSNSSNLEAIEIQQTASQVLPLRGRQTKPFSTLQRGAQFFLRTEKLRKLNIVSTSQANYQQKRKCSIH